MISKRSIMSILVLVLCMCIWAEGAEEKNSNVTITMQHSMVPPEANELLKQYAAQYKEETGVTVEISYVPWESQRATTLSKIASGHTPDILHGNSNQGTAEWVEMGAMSDLSGLLSGKMKEELIPTAFDELGTYAIPFGQSPESAIFYRPALFAEAGVTPPAPGEAWTWEEFVDAAKKLTKDVDGDGIPEQWGFAERGLAGFIAMKSYIPHLWAFGADIIVPDGNNGWKSGLDNPAAKDAIAAQVALVNDQKVLKPNYITWGLPEAMRAWGENNMAMFAVGYWWASSISKEYGHVYGEDYDVMPFPVSEKGNKFGFSTYDYFTIPTTSQNKEEAYKFIEWIMLDSKRMADLTVIDYYIPPTTKSALADPRYSGESLPLWSERFSLWCDSSRFMPASSKYAGLWTSTVIPIWEEIVTGRRSVDDGVALMDKEIKSKLGQK
ncbi:MAG: sugar ABC transporter substrate-binding protein [Sphaerochaetaceae bacterium]|nr:sugar ABC transporter substrate-binding protein [Sphaerochaetaceae bacterium]